MQKDSEELSDIEWDAAVKRTAKRITKELKDTGIPQSVGTPIAIRAVLILGEEIGMLEKNSTSTLRQLEAKIIIDASNER